MPPNLPGLIRTEGVVSRWLSCLVRWGNPLLEQKLALRSNNCTTKLCKAVKQPVYRWRPAGVPPRHDPAALVCG
jgi:hypothetical protein